MTNETQTARKLTATIKAITLAPYGDGEIITQIEDTTWYDLAEAVDRYLDGLGPNGTAYNSVTVEYRDLDGDLADISDHV